jgi:hypothetical protein
MAEGLDRMFSRIGVRSKVFYQGLEMLYRPSKRLGGLRSSARNIYLQMRFYQAMRSYDLIVVVNTIPEAFLSPLQIERLRSWFPDKPVVLYDVMYLPTSGNLWNKWLDKGKPDDPNPLVRRGGNFGLDRYDWYLCASTMSSLPMLPGRQPYSQIGLNLDDGTLYPDQDHGFIALIDFERPNYMKERAIQIQTLEEIGIPYHILEGRYEIADIRKIYRGISIYFLASPESFGLPICELQACGSKILVPYPDWVSAHWIKTDIYQEGPGKLSSNFIVYDNDKRKLLEIIWNEKDIFNSDAVVKTFQKYHPHYWHGDANSLQSFIDQVARGKISSRSHLSYPRFRNISYKMVD